MCRGKARYSSQFLFFFLDCCKMFSNMERLDRFKIKEFGSSVRKLEKIATIEYFWILASMSHWQKSSQFCCFVLRLLIELAFLYQTGGILNKSDLLFSTILSLIALLHFFIKKNMFRTYSISFKNKLREITCFSPTHTRKCF